MEGMALWLEHWIKETRNPRELIIREVFKGNRNTKDIETGGCSGNT